MGINRDVPLIRSCLDRLYPHADYRKKQEIRSALRLKRGAHDVRIARYKSQKIRENALALDAVQSAQTIALYASTPDEVITRGMPEVLLMQGKTVVYPCTHKQHLTWHSIRSQDDLIPGKGLSIPEPNADRCREVAVDTIDLFFVPGVAFDRFGGRIGFGGGYYDRTLEHAREDAAVFGLAYDFQVVPVLSVESHDQMMDGVITERGVFFPRQSVISTASEDETRALAGRLIKAGVGAGSVLGFYADLGVGKTVFVNGLARALKCREETSSPTFIYCREYEGITRMIHIDGYRLDSIHETDEPFWDELVQQEGVVAVEWAERLATCLPPETIHILGDLQPDGTRQWTLVTTRMDQAEVHAC